MRLLGLIISIVLTTYTAVADVLIEHQLAKLAESQGLELGLAAIHLETGKIVQVNGNRQFPLASTYKVPMAAYALHLVEKGKLSFDDMFEVHDVDLNISSPITVAFPHKGLQISLLNLIEPTLVYSDNTATDVLFRAIGGGRPVTTWLHQNGFHNVRIDRSTAGLIRGFLQMPFDGKTSLSKQYMEVYGAKGNEPDSALLNSFYDKFRSDSQDQGTALAMAKFLGALVKGDVISDENTKRLLEIMKRCKTGAERIPAGVPKEFLPIAHKTGSIARSINDVGLIDLVDGSQIALAVFVVGPVGDNWSGTDTQNKLIAAATSKLVQYFTK